MTDDEIRELLAKIEGVSGQWRGEKCVLRDRVGQRSGDLKEVDAWVRRVGGRIERYALARSVPPHMGQQHVLDPLVYMIPLAALVDPADA